MDEYNINSNADDFDEEEFNDEDFATIDALIECIKELPRHETFVINPIRIKQMRYASAIIKRCLRNADCNATVECKQQEFDSTTGVIRIEGVSIEIMGASDFATAIGLATNSEIYPLTNGHVKMALTFQDILLPI